MFGAILLYSGWRMFRHRNHENGDGTFQPLQLAITNCGYTAGGWRVEKHPRMVVGRGSVGG